MEATSHVIKVPLYPSVMVWSHGQHNTYHVVCGAFVPQSDRSRSDGSSSDAYICQGDGGNKSEVEFVLVNGYSSDLLPRQYNNVQWFDNLACKVCISDHNAFNDLMFLLIGMDGSCALLKPLRLV